MSDSKTQTQVVMAIPQDVISAQVQAAVAGILKERGDALIEAMVKEVLTAPARDSYGSELRRYVNGKTQNPTRFQLILEEGIKKAAEEEAKTWVEEQREAIKRAMRAHLGKTHKEVVAKIADAIINKLSTPYVALSLRFEDER